MKPRFLYAIQGASGGPIKLGSAWYVEGRRNDLQCGNPDELVVLGSWPIDSRKLEYDVHAALSSSRKQGEWFKETVYVRKFLEWLRDGVPVAEACEWLVSAREMEWETKDAFRSGRYVRRCRQAVREEHLSQTSLRSYFSAIRREHLAAKTRSGFVRLMLARTFARLNAVAEAQ